MESIKLKKPLTINGAKVEELTYDINEITPAGFAEAEFKKSQSHNTAVGRLMVRNMHRHKGSCSFIRVNCAVWIAFSTFLRTSEASGVNCLNEVICDSPSKI